MFASWIGLLSRSIRSAELRLRWLRRKVLPSRLAVFEDITAAWFSSALGVAAQLQLAKPVPMKQAISLTDLAAKCGVTPDGLQRVLNILVSHGYFAYDSSESNVTHTALSRALTCGQAGSFVMLQSSDWYRSCFAPENVAEALRRDVAPFEQLQGEPFFDLVSRDSTKEEVFAEAMAEITQFCGPFVDGMFSLSPGQRVLDVGGGNGTLCKVLQRRFPSCSFAVLDIRCESCQDSNIEFFEGSFLDSVPGGFDHLIMKNILHDWNDDVVLNILSNCASSAEPGTEITIVELLLPETGRPKTPQYPDFDVDWNLFCTLGGKERTLSQFQELLERTGWQFLEARPTGLPFWLLSARKI